MRIVILMARYSPWSQQTATALASLGHDVHVLDLAARSDDSLANPQVAGNRADYEKFAAGPLTIHLIDAPESGQVRQSVSGTFTGDSLDAEVSTTTYLSGVGDYAMTRTVTAKRVGECAVAASAAEKTT